MRKFFILLPVVLILLSSSAFAQRADGPFRYSPYRWISEKPMIELSYGVSDVKLNNINSEFKSPGMIELRLGYASQWSSRYSKNVLSYENNYVYLSNSTTDIASKTSTGINSSMWRFGIGSKDGMGLKFGSFSIMPYNSNSISWSRFQFDRNSIANSSDYEKFDDFNEAFRFGTSTEAGINLQITKGISLQPKYEVSDIFPRHLVAKQMISSLIEVGGAHMIDEFVRNILQNTPVAGTIVNFVLKNAYEYGIYQLRKENMNWPFTGEAPLRYSTFKMGMTFTF